ncbi:hypothetical protein SELMODRAFT_414072 [Selaginella moellendorffii]|uniref:Uncharacterized protein n=1 Tax=Selaginella moellendorffii TaxID=88036 RepID=D8RRJ7_SELML|nr:hypothetical protein SELMODRAFT_414072 [Selaginella moellendorffii]
MAYPKDKIAFLYIHRENGEVAFISQSASRYVPGSTAQSSDFMFSSMVVSTEEDLEAAKQATRSIAPEINRYTVSMLGAADDQEWTATVYERYIGNGFEGVAFMQGSNASSSKKGRSSTLEKLSACKKEKLKINGLVLVISKEPGML